MPSSPPFWDRVKPADVVACFRFQPVGAYSATGEFYFARGRPFFAQRALMWAMELLDVATLVQRLGRSRSWFYAHRRELEAAGFPLPLPIVGLWDAAAVDAWRSKQGRMEAAAREHVAEKGLNALFGL